VRRVLPATVTVTTLLLLTGLPTASQAGQLLPSWSEYHGATAQRTGWLAWSRADLRAAEEAALLAVQLRPADGPSLLLLTGVLVEQEKWELAHGAASQLKAIGQPSPEGLLLMGRIALELGHWNESKTHYEEAAQRSPKDARGEVGLALLAARHKEDWTSMQRHLHRAREAEPTFHAAKLPLLPGWQVLSDNERFLEALQAVLQP